MIPSMKRLYKYLLTYGLALAFIVSAIIVPVLITNTDFSIYNTEWNGCSELTERTYKTWELLPSISLKNTDTNLMVVHNSLLNYDLESNRSSMLIIGPGLTFSDEEADYIKHFLMDGGKVLLADDFGTGNDLLSKIEATSRFSSSLLIDLAYEKKPQYGVVFDFQDHTITANVSRILLNYATSLLVGRNTTVLAKSSTGSWLDTNMNGKMDEKEEKGPLPVLAIERYGDGELILLSDPSILINLMYKYMDNSILNENLLVYLGSGRDIILIDESHRDAVPLIFVAVATTSTLQKIGILLLLTVTLFSIGTKLPKQIIIKTWKSISSYPGGSGEKKSILTSDETVNIVMSRHPSWDKNILTKIVKEISREGGGKT